jgi:2-polyprenyl-3-methyl-5-hydroxy-6-metoxy-1,4-benzoquinol methylase
MDRLLFTSRDTRFECPLVSSVYYNDESKVAVTWPRLEGEQLNELYEKYYSGTPGEPIHPPADLISPYRGWYDKRWLLGRIVRKLEMPFRLQQVINHRAETGTWGQITWRDLKGALGGRVRADDASVRFLDAGCFEGEVLDELREQTAWRLTGLEPNALAVEKARAKGHTVHEAFVEDAGAVIPEHERFDVIFLGQVIEHVNDPAMVVRRLTQLLRPGGLLVLSTPNLDSAQARMFGPTWSHWHVPYHRVLFGIESMKELGRVCGLKPVRVRTHSNSFWSGYSVKVNELGVAGSAPHTWHPDPKTMRTARSVSAWSRLLWNWRGKGDYLFAVYRKA